MLKIIKSFVCNRQIKPMKKFLLPLMVVSLFGTGCGTSSQVPAAPQPTTPQAVTTPSITTTPNPAAAAATSTGGITLADVAKHATEQDCWMVIHDNVYDVTKFIPNHPGGKAILMGCGKDATKMFEQRPGDGGSHGGGARSQLEQFQIGNLKQ